MEMTLGKRIADLRKKKGMTQEELAANFSISAQAVSKWENDVACPDIGILPELARTLNVSVDELLSGEPVPAVVLVPEAERKDLSEMMLRIVVNSSGGDRVRVNLPMALIQAALEMGMEMPQISGNEALKNIDLRQIIELVRRGAMGNLVEVESHDGDIVQIFVE